ncbi:hypothetical protein BDW68DRAFT_180924 [Aspergillus falconensis]
MPGQKKTQKQDVQNEIEKKEVDKVLKKEQISKEETKAIERSKLMRATCAKIEGYDKYAAPLVRCRGNGGSRIECYSHFYISAVASDVGVAVAGAAAYIYYEILKADLFSIEEAQERRDHEIREHEASKATLEKTPIQLSAESK